MAGIWAWGVPIPIGANQVWGNFQPDEENHIRVILYIAGHGALPAYNFTFYESAHPPLYHVVAAFLYAGTNSFLGMENSLRLLRLFSTLMGTATVWTVGRAAQNLFPRRYALFAPWIVACNPTWTCLCGGITNEVWTAWASAGALAVMLLSVRSGFTPMRIVSLAVWVTLAAGAKVTAFGLIPAACVALWLAARHHKTSMRTAATQAAAVICPFFVVMGGWFWRNTVDYGDPLLLRVTEAVWAERIPGYEQLATQEGVGLPRYIARVAWNGSITFWGSFDGAARTLPPWAFCIIGGILILAILSLLRRRLKIPLFLPFVPFVIFALWIATVYFAYNYRHFTPQGRFFFPLLLPFALGLSFGLQSPPIPRQLRILPLLMLTGVTLYALLRYNPVFREVMP